VFPVSAQTPTNNDALTETPGFGLGLGLRIVLGLELDLSGGGGDSLGSCPGEVGGGGPWSHFPGPSFSVLSDDNVAGCRKPFDCTEVS